MAILAALALTSCTGPDQEDPRAYPGSPAGQRFESVLKSFALKSGKVEDVGFSGTSEYPYKDLSLGFRAPKECIERFLKDHGVDVNKSTQWPFVDPPSPPIPERDVKRFGWHFDPKRKYDSYGGFRTPNGSTFRVVVDPRGAVETLYMKSEFSGES